MAKTTWFRDSTFLDDEDVELIATSNGSELDPSLHIRADCGTTKGNAMCTFVSGRARIGEWKLPAPTSTDYAEDLPLPPEHEGGCVEVTLGQGTEAEWRAAYKVAWRCHFDFPKASGAARASAITAESGAESLAANAGPASGPPSACSERPAEAARTPRTPAAAPPTAVSASQLGAPIAKMPDEEDAWSRAMRDAASPPLSRLAPARVGSFPSLTWSGMAWASAGVGGGGGGGTADALALAGRSRSVPTPCDAAPASPPPLSVAWPVFGGRGAGFGSSPAASGRLLWAAAGSSGPCAPADAGPEGASGAVSGNTSGAASGAVSGPMTTPRPGSAADPSPTPSREAPVVPASFGWPNREPVPFLSRRMLIEPGRGRGPTACSHICWLVPVRRAGEPEFLELAQRRRVASFGADAEGNSGDDRRDAQEGGADELGLVRAAGAEGPAALAEAAAEARAVAAQVSPLPLASLPPCSRHPQMPGSEAGGGGSAASSGQAAWEYPVGTDPPAEPGRMPIRELPLTLSFLPLPLALASPPPPSPEQKPAEAVGASATHLPTPRDNPASDAPAETTAPPATETVVAPHPRPCPRPHPEGERARSAPAATLVGGAGLGLKAASGSLGSEEPACGDDLQTPARRGAGRPRAPSPSPVLRGEPAPGSEGAERAIALRSAREPAGSEGKLAPPAKRQALFSPEHPSSPMGSSRIEPREGPLGTPTCSEDPVGIPLQLKLGADDRSPPGLSTDGRSEQARSICTCSVNPSDKSEWTAGAPQLDLAIGLYNLSPLGPIPGRRETQNDVWPAVVANPWEDWLTCQPARASMPGSLYEGERVPASRDGCCQGCGGGDGGTLDSPSMGLDACRPGVRASSLAPPPRSGDERMAALVPPPARLDVYPAPIPTLPRLDLREFLELTSKAKAGRGPPPPSR